jgi:hypothetical protein
MKTVPRQEIEDRIKEIESDKKSPNKISKRLSAPHQITSNTKEWFESAENYWEKRSKNKLILPISVEKKHLSRALLIVDFLIKLLEYRGHNFDLNGRNENIVRISGRDLHISIRNVGKYVNNYQNKYATRDFVFTDVLCIQMYEDTWNRKEWKDTPYSPIEEKLIRVVAYLELFAKYSAEYHKELKEHWRKQDLIRQAELEKKEHAEKEKRNLEQLIVDAENFDRAQKIVNYLKERKLYLEENNLFSREEAEYFEWGIKQCMKLNPLHNFK